MMMRPLAYPLTPVPASIATNVFLYTSPPTRCCSAFLKCPKDGTPGKSDGKTCVSVSLRVCVCVYLCKLHRTQESMSESFCQMSRATRLHPLSLHLCPLFLSLSPQVVVTYVELCMDCLHGFPPLTVTLTTVSITSVTYTAIKSDCFIL